MEFLTTWGPLAQTFVMTLFTWSVTAFGAAVVFLFKEINHKVLDTMMGFGAGVMIAASFWSLLDPAIALAEQLGGIAWFWPGAGFLIGGLFIVSANRFFDRFGLDSWLGDGNTSLRRSALLILAVTLHNIPEGMAVGVAFAGAHLGIPGSTVATAALLAVGIGLQNFPEGAAVSLPLRREGFSRGRSFWYGQLSGVVEPISGLIGAAAVLFMRPILPFMLGFAAGAMIGVVSGELLPESTRENKELAVLGVTLGFLVMMVMDVALG